MINREILFKTVTDVHNLMPEHKLWEIYYVLQFPDANYHIPLMVIAIYDALTDDDTKPFSDRLEDSMKYLDEDEVYILESIEERAYDRVSCIPAFLVKPYAEKVLREDNFYKYWEDYNYQKMYTVSKEKLTDFFWEGD